MRENLDMGRPDHVQLIFNRRVSRRTPTVAGDHRVRVGDARTNVLRLKLRIVIQDGVRAAWANRLRMSSTDSRMSPAIGLPPKTSDHALCVSAARNAAYLALR